MKYSEAEKQIKALSSKYNFNMSDGDFIVNYKNMLVAWVKNNKRYLLYNNENCFKKIPFSNKLYMILAELAMTPIDERKEDKKYFIHVFKGYDGYLNFAGGKPELNDIHDSGIFKTKFTNKEIEELKQRDDVPLNWDKVTFEEAK